MELEINKIIKDKLGYEATIDAKLKTTNNSVYIIDYHGEKYIFKIYRSKNWPENGKLLYVNKLLEQNNIKYPKVIDYTRSHAYFENGYVLEQKINGIPILNKKMNLEFGVESYRLLAKFIKKVHEIKFESYGYINNGNPDYLEFSEYVRDILEENLDILFDNNVLKKEDLSNLVDVVCDEFDKFNISPVLSHGDLSMRNVIYDGEDVVLIDWDDAMALPYQADIARMTFDMKFMRLDNYNVFRGAFLDEYFDGDFDVEYSRFEKIYHIFEEFSRMWSHLN